MMISVVFPAYNEEDNVEELHRRLKAVLNSMGEPYEIIAVENGSNDKTLEKLKKLRPVKIIVLPRNYGQTLALDAGIQAARGEVIVTLDADLQNDPQDIPKMIEKMKEGYDLVVGWRQNRQDTLGRKVFSRSANWLTRRMLGLYLHDYACALKTFKKEFMSGIHLYGEMHVFLPAILISRGAKVTEIPVRHYERKGGASKYVFGKAVKVIADLLTVKFLFNYAARPLLFFGGWGVVSIVIAFLFALGAVVSVYQQSIHIIESPFLPLASVFLVLGFILFMMGFLAELILRVYYEGRRETPYIIREIIENESR